MNQKPNGVQRIRRKTIFDFVPKKKDTISTKLEEKNWMYIKYKSNSWFFEDLYLQWTDCPTAFRCFIEDGERLINLNTIRKMAENSDRARSTKDETLIFIQVQPIFCSLSWKLR